MVEDSTKVDSTLDSATLQALNVDVSATVNDIPQPQIALDIASRMHLEKIGRSDPGPHITIDVLPDFRNILYQLIDHSVKIYQQIDQLKSPLLSPASILAYCLQTIYAYGAITDSGLVRETASFYASAFKDIPQYKEHLTLLGWNKVPPFIEPILKGLEYTFDSRRKEVSYMYSLAACSLNIDYGRIFPIQMFFSLHDLIAQHSTQESEQQIWLRWLNTTAIEITETNEIITVAHIIGAAYNDNQIMTPLVTRIRTLLSQTMKSNINS